MAINPKYDYLESFLLAFHADIDYESEKDVIKEEVETVNKNNILKTLQHGEEVLMMDPFPWEWIADLTNRLVYDKDLKEWVEDPQIYKEWLKSLLGQLKEEARKQGKFE